MGDSVLGFVITKMLFDKYEARQEGFLTKARTKLVRGTTLAEIAQRMGLNKMIYVDLKVRKFNSFGSQVTQAASGRAVRY